MYSLELMDGTIINNLHRKNPSTFWVEGDSSLYWLLTDDNLACATLYNDDDIDDILIDYHRQNFMCQNNIVEFRLSKKEE